jgi:WXG100 family type VII secretion target
MVGGYTVDPAELRAGDAGLAGTAAATRAALARLLADAAPVLTVGWQGEAAAAFRLGWEHWVDGVTTMLTALDELAAVLGAAGSGYAATETAVQTAIGRAAR